jgi:hypothetical protein
MKIGAGLSVIVAALFLLQAGCETTGSDEEEGGSGSSNSSSMPSEVSFSLDDSTSNGGYVTLSGYTLSFEIQSASVHLLLDPYNSNGGSNIELDAKDSSVVAVASNNLGTLALHVTDEEGSYQNCTGTLNGSTGSYQLLCGITVEYSNSTDSFSIYVGEIPFSGVYDFSTGILDFSVEGEYQNIEFAVDVDLEGDARIPKA